MQIKFEFVPSAEVAFDQAGALTADVQVSAHIVGLDASKVTSGVLDPARLPPGAGGFAIPLTEPNPDGTGTFVFEAGGCVMVTRFAEL